MAGYGNRWGSWHVSREAAGDLSGNPSRGLLEQRPAIGESRWLRITFPFDGTSEESFWCLYEPPMMLINGFDREHGGEIRDLAFVKCRMVGCESIDRTHAVATVMIESVMDIGDLLRISLSAELPELDLWRDVNPDRTTQERQDDLLFVESNWEGDTGLWAILRLARDATELLVYAVWGFHEDHFWAGRALLIRQANTAGPDLPWPREGHGVCESIATRKPA